MTSLHDPPTPEAGTGYRLACGALGVLLLSSGVYALRYVSAGGVLQFVGALALMLVGAEAVLSAMRARPSWLSKLGPLP